MAVGDCGGGASIGDAHRGRPAAGRARARNEYFRTRQHATGTTITINLSGTRLLPRLQMRGGLAARRGARKMYRAAMRRLRFNRFPDVSTSTNGGWWAAFACCFFSLRYCCGRNQFPLPSLGPILLLSNQLKNHKPRAPQLRNPRTLASTNGNSLAGLDRDTSNSLDALKDQLFRLELRRQGRNYQRR